MRTQLVGLVVVLVILVQTRVLPGATTGQFSDDFEDDTLDSTLWVVGGGARGTWHTSPLGTGGWSHWETETHSAGDPDGYLDLGARGPTSGNSFGGEAWVRTVHDYNDGRDYTVNFTWQADVVDSHFNHYQIQVTDGFIADPENLHWPERLVPGTTNLLWGVHSSGDPVRYGAYSSDQSKLTWSILIDPSGSAGLYDGPNGTGSLLRSESLDLGSSWYVRFFLADATSAGFPAGEAHLKFYDFSSIPEPATLALLALGGLALVRRRK